MNENTGATAIKLFAVVTIINIIIVVKLLLTFVSSSLLLDFIYSSNRKKRMKGKKNLNRNKNMYVLQRSS